jgi:flagellin
MLTIQTDVNSLNIQNNLGVNNANMQTAVQRLSSGFRINSAADDSAGYAIAANLSKTNASLQAGSNNAMQASAMLNIANAAVNQIQDMLVRLQTLATEAASGNNSSTADANLNTEAGKLLTEINNIASSTQYNGVNLLDGSGGSALSIQVGDTNTSTEQVTLDLSSKFTTASFGAVGTGTGVNLSGTNFSISTQANAQTALGTLSTAMTDLSTAAAKLGASVNQLNYVNSYLSSASTQMSSAISTIKDANMAQEMANYTKDSILVQAGTSMLAQTKQVEQNVLSLFR